MLKQLLLSAAVGTLALNVSAQVEDTDDIKKKMTVDGKDTVAWVRGGVGALGINQAFLHNWAAGGEVLSMTINGTFSGYLNRIYHRHVWSNNLDMTYGLLYAYSNKFVPRKIDDRFDFTSKYGYQLDKKGKLFFSGLMNFRTQFSQGYDYSIPNWESQPTSNRFSPAYLTLALGLEYREGTKYSLFFSPVAARFTFADKYYTLMSPEGAFGIDYGKTSRFELGAYFSGRYQTEINKKLLFKTRLDLYSNYLAKDKKDSLGVVVKKDSPGNVDILWDNFFSYKISKYMGVTIGLTAIYDNDLPYKNTYTDATTGNVVKKDEPGQGFGWWQIKQLLSVGLEYRF
jgi:hypothetical protein